MPHKLERQYQLQAQKRQEEFQRYNYCKQTARYFEREAAAVKQFSSWSARDSKTYNDRLQKSQQIEKLQSRREKLRQLLSTEDELYQLDLTEKQQSKRRVNEQSTLDDLRRTLLEKKAEQSLYYPKSCRRLRSFTVSPTTVVNKFGNLNVNDETDNIRSTEKNSQISNYVTSSQTENSLKSEVNTSMEVPSENIHRTRRFASQNTRRSLENTNIHYSNHSKSSNSVSSNEPQQNLKINDCFNKGSSSEISYINEEYHHLPETCNQMENVQSSENTQKDLYQQQSSSNTDKQTYQNDNLALQYQSESNSIASLEAQEHAENETHENVSQLEETDSVTNLNRDRKSSIFEKETDWYEGADMSVQMYRYLKHNDLKNKIVDLFKRERLFVIKKCWCEALRLREMRNKLILLKTKNLYENHDLKIDDNVRQAGLNIIKARELLMKKRGKIYDSILYSDEAKSLWKQWILEDDEIAKTETNLSRNLRLMELENDWKNLALRDKKRMSQIYEQVMTKSDLQEELKLAANFRQIDKLQQH